VSVTAVVHAAVETSRSMASKHRVALEEDCREDLPALRIDEVKMRQVVVNLIVNAIKFSPDGGRVVVHAAREPKYVRVEVRDQGRGGVAPGGLGGGRARPPGRFVEPPPRRGDHAPGPGEGRCDRATPEGPSPKLHFLQAAAGGCTTSSRDRRDVPAV